MLINLRNALMAGRRLPYDAEVEHLESTGTQWIDTGVASKQTLKIRAIFETNSSTSYFAYGVRYDDSTITCATGTNINGAVRWGVSALTGAVPRGLADVTQDSSGVWESGKFYSYSATQTVVERSGFTITLFAGRNSETTVTANMVGKFYSCKIWDNGILVRDYIPVRKGTVGYLYDRVSGKLFGNAGTGDFVLGPDVVPVEYIESHGTEWIDTGVTSGPSNLEFTIDCTITNTIGTTESNWTGSGVNSVGGLHYVLEQRGIRTGGGSVANSIPYTSGERVQIRTYYDEQNRRRVQIGDRYYYGSAYSAPTANLCLLRMVNLANQKGFFFSATASQSGALVRKFLPVRVGTEGAMMDVLTRRVYRNAGTGAFSYGNDLKYPIPAE